MVVVFFCCKIVTFLPKSYFTWKPVQWIFGHNCSCPITRDCAFVYTNLFADDVVLLSPSRHGLQQLLNICATYCLDFNVKKSKIMIIGKKLTESHFASLLLNDQPLEFVKEYKYLGVELCAGKTLTFSPLSMIRSFHRAANAIFYSRVKQVKRFSWSSFTPIACPLLPMLLPPENSVHRTCTAVM